MPAERVEHAAATHAERAPWQAPIIKDKYCLCHLATGDLLRAAVSAGTPRRHALGCAAAQGELS